MQLKIYKLGSRFLSRHKILEPILLLMIRCRVYNLHLRLVGGCLRDLLLNTKVIDLDLAAAASIEDLMSTLSKLGYRVLGELSGIRYGTVVVLLEDLKIEITILRGETYNAKLSRRPNVVPVSFWYQDMCRRDFTMNALSMDFLGNVYDYFNGCWDLRRGRIRFVRDVKQRIKEDKLRVLRFIRFKLTYGHESWGRYVRILQPWEGSLRHVSTERKWEEWRKIFNKVSLNKLSKMLRRLGKLTRYKWTNQVIPRRLTINLEGIDPYFKMIIVFQRDVITFLRMFKPCSNKLIKNLSKARPFNALSISRFFLERLNSNNKYLTFSCLWLSRNHLLSKLSLEVQVRLFLLIAECDRPSLIYKVPRDV